MLMPAQTGGSPPALPRARDGSIETLRGLALLSLVAFHASVEAPPDFVTSGAEHYGAYTYAATSLAYIRMPLFTVISGFVYALRPVQVGDGLRFLHGKARRLLLPLVSLVTLTLLLAHLAGSGGDLAVPLQEWHRAYLWPYTHFWFLQAMCWVFVAVVLLERAGVLSHLIHWVWALLASCALKYALPDTSFFSMDGFGYLLPFFILGIGLHRFADRLSTWPLCVGALAVAMIGLGLQQLALVGELSLDPTDKGSPLATITGLAAATAIVLYRVRIPFLVALGGYSYAAYLFHHLGLSLGKQAYMWLGLSSMHGLFLAKWSCGLVAGVVAEHVLRPLPGLNTLFLGLSPSRRRVSSAAVATTAASS